MPLDTTIEIGDRIGPDGKYEIIKPLGEGGMGVVFKAFDRFLERDVAIKTILLRKNQSDAETVARNLRERFLREARAVARVQHPNIIQIFEIGVDRERPFMAMELIDGDDLSKLKDKLTLEEICFAGDGVASALDFMHQKGLYHRDVKPQNVMFSRNRQVKLMDFGIAKDTQKETLTEYGTKLGTPLYMAPEILFDNPVFSGKSDQYALTVILYELLTMQYPFLGSNIMQLVGAIQAQPPRAAAKIAPWIPALTEAVLDRGLSKDPNARYGNCGVLLGDFRRSLGDLQSLQGVIDRRRFAATEIWNRSHQNDLAGLKRLAAEYQDWPYRDNALERIQELEAEGRTREAWERVAQESFEDAKRRRSPGQLKAFLQRYGDSRCAPAAKELLAQLEREAAEEEKRQRERLAAEQKTFETARQMRDAEALHRFVVEFPESAHITDALSLISEIQLETERRTKQQQQREREARTAFHNSAISRDPAALKEWLRRYPDLTTLVPQVQNKLQALEAEATLLSEQEKRRKEAEDAQIQQIYEKAVRANDISALKSFVSFYPGAPQAENARSIIQKAEEQQRQKAEEQQRQKAEEQQRQKAEEQQRRKAEEQQRQRAEEQQRLQRLRESEQAYQQAAAAGDPQPLRNFLRDYPTSQRVPEAKLQLDEIDRRLAERARVEAEARAEFERAKSRRDLSSLTGFMQRNPADPRAAEAEALIAEIEAERLRLEAERAKQAEQFERARSSRDPQALRKFLEEAPNSPDRGEAARLLKEIEEWIKRGDQLFDRAKSAASISTAQQFLQTYPNHPRSSEAQHLIEELQARIREEAVRRRQEEQAAWTSVQNLRDPARLGEFISRFPDGPFSVQAKALQEAWKREVQQTLESEDPEQIRRFLADNPKMIAPGAAEHRLQQLEQDTWNRLDTRDTGQLDYFLRRYPDGAHAPTARSTLERIRQEEKAYRNAISPGDGQPSAEALRRFQETYPESRHALRVATQLDLFAKQAMEKAAASVKPAVLAGAAALAAGGSQSQAAELPPIADDAETRSSPPQDLPPDQKPHRSKLPKRILAGAAVVVFVVLGIKLWPPKPVPQPVPTPEKVVTPDLPKLPKDTSDDDAWSSASTAQSPEPAKAYLGRFPKGKHTVEAEARIKLFEKGAAEAFDSAGKSGDPGQLEAFARGYPWSSLQSAATQQAADLRREEDAAFREVAKAPTADKIRAFQQKYPWSNRLTELRDKQGEEDRWTGLASSKSPKDYDEFARKFPQGVHAAEARTKSQQLHADELREWSRVGSSDNVTDMQQFKAAFPWSEHLPQVDAAIERMRQDELDWASLNQTDPRSIRRFLDSHPNSRHAKEGRLKETELTDRANRAYELTKKDDPAALDRFAKDFPWSSHAPEAIQRIETIRIEKDKAEAERIEKEKAARATAEKEKENKETVEKVEVKPPVVVEPLKPKAEDIHGKDGLLYKAIPGKPFAMSESETTVEAFDAFLKSSGASPKNSKKASLPVVNITFTEAENYCKWVGGRLPTSAEWEYAAHGGKTSAYPNGDTITARDAAYGLTQNLSRVKSFAPNGYGLYDMAGNVAEMVQGPLLKGGHHLSSKDDLKITSVYGPRNKDAKDENNGFRCLIPTAGR